MSLVVEQISKKYQDKAVLADVTVSFEPQKIYGLLGRNGAGKSTLLNIINNRSFASAGQVLLDGKPLTENEKELNQIYLMSEDNLFPGSMKVKDIFKISAGLYGTFDWEFATELVAAFELDTNLKFRKLSTGYRSIAKLITALCVPCDYIFLDEPVLGLDANYRDLFYGYLVEAYEKRPRTFIVSTHLIEEITNLFEEVIIIDHGKIELTDTVENILRESNMISGPREQVESFAEHLNVVGKEELGGLVNVYVSGELHQAIPENITVAPVNLQTYFIQLTKGKKGI